MPEAPAVAVLDASVGVKCFKAERGSEDAWALMEAHRSGEVAIVVPALFIHEVVGTAVRHGGPAFGREVCDALRDADLTVLGLDEALAQAALAQCEDLGCTFYDAMAPALARLLNGTLYSADAKAHAAFDGVRLIG